VGRPSGKPKVFYYNVRYRAGSWDCARRVVVKVAWHAGELFPRVGFIVTNLKWRAKKVARFYNRRGTAEQWIKKGKNAVKWTRLSCRRFKDNPARLQLFALAYNLANVLRQLALPRSIRSWALTTLREKLVKIGAKVVTHAKYVVFQLAEVAVPVQVPHQHFTADSWRRESPFTTSSELLHRYTVGLRADSRAGMMGAKPAPERPRHDSSP
jgi:hypothetical protein